MFLMRGGQRKRKKKIGKEGRGGGGVTGGILKKWNLLKYEIFTLDIVNIGYSYK